MISFSTACSANEAMFMGSLHFVFETHWDHEPSAVRIIARASWSAATESSESPLWFGLAVSAASFGSRSQSGDFADSVNAVQNLTAE